MSQKDKVGTQNAPQTLLKVGSKRSSSSSEDPNDEILKLHSNKFTTVENTLNYFNFYEQNWGQKFYQHHPKLFEPFQQTELSKFSRNINVQEKIQIYEKNQIFQQCIIKNKTLSFLQNYQQHHRTKLEQKLLRSGRFKKVNSFRTELLIEEIHSSKHCEIIKLETQLLCYKTQILVLNNIDNCPLASMFQVSDSGSFGTVYLLKTQNEELAIKCLPLQRKKNKENHCVNLLKSSQTIIEGIEEYFFILLLSQMEIGPKAKTIGGFDMILNKDYIEFGTQICQPQKEDHQKVEEELSESLFQMHMLQIVHQDIKPSNIMYSQTFKKHVFIDFGCSEGLKETLGQKKVTQFKGTTLYCGNQMLALLSKKLGEVDLYFNDIVSLGKSFKSQQFETLGDQIVSEIESPTFLILKMEFELYSQKYEQFNETWRNVSKQYFSESERIQVELLQFFKDLKINQQLRDFYWKEIDENIREMPEFRQLRILMQGKSFNLISEIANFPLKEEQYSNFLKLFQHIKIQCSNFTKEQTEISLILFSKQSVTKYFQEIETLLSKNQDFTKQFDAIKLSVVVAYYATFAENKYEASVQEKIKACNLAVKVLEKGNHIKLGIQNPFGRFFQISVKQLCEVSYFYQVFWFRIWRSVPQNHRDKSALNSIITLYLISPPLIISALLLCIYDDPNQLIERNQFSDLVTKENEDENIPKPQIFFQTDEALKIKRMCLFWQILLIDLIFQGSVFYIKHQSTNQHKILSSIEKQIIVKEKGWIEDDLQNKVLKMSRNYYETLRTINQRFDKRSLNELFMQLQSPQIIELQAVCPTLGKMRFLIKTVFFCLIGRQQQFSLRNSPIDQSNETMHFFQSYKNNIIMYQIVLFLNRGENFDKLSMILRRIQGIFNFKELFFRLGLQIQLRLSMRANDRAFLKRVTQTIKSQLVNLKTFTIEKNETLIFILRTIQTFIEQQIRKSSTINPQLINILSEHFQFVSFGWQIGYYYFFERESCSLILPKDEYSHIELYHVILEDKSFRSFIRVLVSLGKLYEKILCNTEYQQHRMAISERHIKFINCEEIHLKLSRLSTKWLRILILNPHLKNIIKQSFHILKIFVNLYFGEFRTISQIQTASDIVDLLFQDLRPGDFSVTEKKEFLPPLDIAFDYYQIELIKTQYGRKQCEDILELYQISAKQNTFQTVLALKGILRFIFNAFIFAERPFEDIFQYLLHLSQCVGKIAQNSVISIFLQELQFFFWCQCQNCFPRKPQNWYPKKFTQYLYQKIESLNPIQNPYMSLVFFHSMTQKTLETKVVRKFVIYVLKSIKFVAHLAQRDILKRIYFYAFQSFYFQERENNFFLIIDKNRSLKSNISKSQKNDKNHRRFLHNYFMQIKYDECIKVSLQNLIQKGFCKEYYFNDYRYPLWIREVYKRKLRRFFEVKSNYSKNPVIKDVFRTKDWLFFYQSPPMNKTCRSNQLLER